MKSTISPIYPEEEFVALCVSVLPSRSLPLTICLPASLSRTLVAVSFSAVWWDSAFYASQHSRVEIEPERLRLVGDFWGRTIPVERLDVSAARIVDLNRGSDYLPKRRTFGTGLPGYASGWFRLRNGEKALVYLTRGRSVVYLPTSEGYALLLSVAEPERFLQVLQR